MSLQNITNPIYSELLTLGILNPRAIRKISNRTRDAAIPVYIDDQSKVIFLESVQTSEEYYEKEKSDNRQAGSASSQLLDGSTIRSKTLEDDQRRFEQFRSLLESRSLCDFGAGYGGFLTAAKGSALRCAGVELRDHCHRYMQDKEPSITYRKSIEGHDGLFDIVTMFHVLEHLPSQIGALKAIVRKIRKGGRLIVEVPHARDFLIQSIDLPEFRTFTFWSEHLVLHTEESLRAVLAAAGLTDITISAFQRYGYTNHLNWFLNRRPGGHETLKHLQDARFESEYRDLRCRTATSDTLIAIVAV